MTLRPKGEPTVNRQLTRYGQALVTFARRVIFSRAWRHEAEPASCAFAEFLEPRLAGTSGVCRRDDYDLMIRLSESFEDKGQESEQTLALPYRRSGDI